MSNSRRSNQVVDDWEDGYSDTEPEVLKRPPKSKNAVLWESPDVVVQSNSTSSSSSSSSSIKSPVPGNRSIKILQRPKHDNQDYSQQHQPRYQVYQHEQQQHQHQQSSFPAYRSKSNTPINSRSSQTSSPKSLQEREREYQEARARIFGRSSS